MLAIGFDVEWRPSNATIEPETLISLIQLATTKSALLIQIKYLNTIESRQTLTEILNNKNIIKVGVNVLNDLKKLEKDYGKNFFIDYFNLFKFDNFYLYHFVFSLLFFS